MTILTLLTDFGTTDYYAGAVKGVVLGLAPGATLVDLSHDLAAGDVAAGAFVWAAATASFPAGCCHLAVVDPGVGSGRRILAIAAGGSVYLAPDNGLATWVLERHPEASCYAVDRPDLYLAAPGATFHGRDRFAPLAAFLLCGGQASDLGAAIEDPARLPLPPPSRGAERLTGHVIHIDRYGNLVTDVPAAWLAGSFSCVAVGYHRVERLVSHYAELGVGEAAALVGSLGTLELSANHEHLANRWRVTVGTAVEVLLPNEG